MPKFTSIRLVSTLLALAAIIFIWQISSRMNNPGTADFPIFLDHADSYLEYGEIYQNADDYFYTYVPTAPLYKFPPLYGSILIELMSLGYTDAQITSGMAIVQLCAFLLSLAMIFALLSSTLKLEAGLLSLIAGLLFFPVLHDNLKTLQPEPFMLLALCMSLYFLSRKNISTYNDFLSGLLVGIATMIKLYPALIAFYYIGNKRWFGLLGMVTSFVLTNILTLSVIGLNEHIRFYSQILPVLLAEKPAIDDAINLSPSALPLYFGTSEALAQFFSKTLLVTVLIIYLKKNLSPVVKKSQQQNSLLTIIDFSIITLIAIITLANSWWNYQLLMVLPTTVAVALVFEKKPVHRKHLLLLATSFILFFMASCLAMNADHGLKDMTPSLQFLYYLSRSGINIVVLFLLWTWKCSER